MKQRLWLVLVLSIGIAANVFAVQRPKAKVLSRPSYLSAKAALDTVFFDNFETDTMGWTVADMTVQPPYWHIDTYNAYSGHSFWCGTNTDVGGWIDPPGYGDGWAQFLVSPEIDLSLVTSDSVILSYWQDYRLENPDPGQDWDCINLWVTTSDDTIWTLDNWQIIYPDTLRAPSTKYNVDDPYSWHYVGLVPDGVKIPGWGGVCPGWHQAYFDLSAYKGQKIKIAFIGTSDALQSDQTHQSPVTYHGMWFLDDILVDTVSSGGSPASIFAEDCESGMGTWKAHGKVPVYFWHKTTRQAVSPNFSWWNGNESTGLYRWGQSDAIVSPVIDLRQVRSTDPCYADFKVMQDIPDDGSDANELNDWYSIEMSADSGRNWLDLAGFIFGEVNMTWTDQSLSWTADLSDFVGKTVMVRIGFGSDGDNNVGEGMYVDNFIVYGKTREALPKPNTILLVDNDGNAVDLADNSWTKYFESTISNLGYRYSLVSIGGNKTMYPGYLEQFPMVIWNFGSNYDTRDKADYKALTLIDEENIKSYLNNGGKLWFSGQTFMGFGNPDTTAHPNLWSDYLHLAPDSGWFSSPTYKGYGVASDPIGDGLMDSLLYSPLNGGGYFWTAPVNAFSLTPDPAYTDAVTFLTADDGSCIGMRYWDGVEGDYKMVYTSFPFEAISTQEKRDTLAARILQWMTPGMPEYVPPAVPTGLTAVQDYDSVICTWNANSEGDLAGYKVYRSLQVSLPYWELIGTVTAPETTFVDTNINAGDIYHYAVTAFDDAFPPNESVYSTWYYLQITAWKTGVEGDLPTNRPTKFNLSQNRPNPFNGQTNIEFAMPVAGRVSLVVYNITGQRVRMLADGDMNSGYYNVTWNGRDDNGKSVANGVYFYRLEAMGGNGQKYSQTKRLNLVK